MKKFISALSLVLISSPVMAAVDTTKVYNSGILVFAFLGFCAMIVIAQLIPAIFLLVTSVKAAFQKPLKSQVSRV